MRATTLETPNVSCARRAEMMLELSPLETAAKASARSMPADRNTSRSKPKPVTVMPVNSAPSRRNASEFWSITATEWPRASRLWARVEPSRPHPMITTCTVVAPSRYSCRHAERATRTGEPWDGAAHNLVVAAVVLTLVASSTSLVKRLLLGRPFRSDRLQHTLLPKRIALPVFASDALSSVAYAPDEILLTLSIAGAGAYVYSPWVTLAVAVVMVTVVASYRQNVHAYPSGGGDYEVATVNLGPRFGVAVASALLVDYILTVAVSVSAGVSNLGSVGPFVAAHKIGIALAAVALLTALNLRGLRESGTAFAIPTYAFIVVIVGMILTGLVRVFILGQELRAPSAGLVIDAEEHHLTSFAFVFLLLRTFSSGCAALTGVEAISNGVPAFKPPKSKNAATTLLLLGSLAIVMLVGIITLARATHLQFVEDPATQIIR